MNVTPAQVAAVQTKRVVDWYLLQGLSPYLTAPLMRLGFSANAATVLWGALGLFASFLVYLGILGHRWPVPVIFIALMLQETLDFSDGEIARLRGTSSPIGGKLLDGIAHKGTEFALMAAFVCGAAVIESSRWVVPIGVALIAGEAMLTYVYERRLLVIRVHLQSGETQSGATAPTTYTQAESWSSFSWRQRLKAVAYLLRYKSVYPVIAVAWWRPELLMWLLAALALYKHWSWYRLIARTVSSSQRAASA